MRHHSLPRQHPIEPNENVTESSPEDLIAALKDAGRNTTAVEELMTAK